MSDTAMEILEMISPAYNAPLDEALHKKILAARATMIELEKMKTEKNPIPAGSGQVLRELTELEHDVCSLPAFMFYYEETAHAYMLNDDPQKALEHAASALMCAQVLENEASQAELLGLLFKIAVFAKAFRMGMDFLKQKKAIRPLESDMKEAYESLEALIENGIEPASRLHVPDGELRVTEPVLELLQRGPAEMAARLIRRAGGMTMAKARREAQKLTEQELGSMFGA